MRYIMPAVISFLVLFYSLSAVDVSGQADWVSRFIWRGFDLTNNTACLQPQLNFEFGESGFTLNIWGSFALADRSRLKTSDEIDLTLTYSFRTGEHISLQTGIIHYGYYFVQGFSFRKSTTQEVFICAGFPKLPLSPTFSLFYDWNLGKGLYASAGIEHILAVSQNADLELGATLGYNHRQYISGSGVSDLVIKAALPIRFKPVTFSFQAGYVIVFINEVNPGNEIWFGLSLIFD